MTGRCVLLGLFLPGNFSTGNEKKKSNSFLMLNPSQNQSNFSSNLLSAALCIWRGSTFVPAYRVVKIVVQCVRNFLLKSSWSRMESYIYICVTTTPSNPNPNFQSWIFTCISIMMQRLRSIKVRPFLSARSCHPSDCRDFRSFIGSAPSSRLDFLNGTSSWIPNFVVLKVACHLFVVSTCRKV